MLATIIYYYLNYFILLGHSPKPPVIQLLFALEFEAMRSFSVLHTFQGEDRKQTQIFVISGFGGVLGGLDVHVIKFTLLQCTVQ